MPEDFTNGLIRNFRHLVVYCDGACEPKNPGGVATAGWAIFAEDAPVPTSPLAQEAVVVRDGRGTNDPKATNNYAEYCALGKALRFLKDQGWKGGSVQVHSDSKLMVNQVSTKWKCNPQHLKELRQRIWTLLDDLDLLNVNMERVAEIGDTGLWGDINEGEFLIHWIPRDQNEFADELSKRAYTEYVGSHPPVRTKKTPPPKKKFKPGEEPFHCMSCGYKGKMKELRIDEGDFTCPICQVSTIDFDV